MLGQTEAEAPAPDRAAALLELIVSARGRAAHDPFGNPVLAAALAIGRKLDDGELEDEDLPEIVARLRDAAASERADRLARYVGGTERATSEAALRALAAELIRDGAPTLREMRARLEHTSYACVFTAHPTFAMAGPAYAALAERASGRDAAFPLGSHRPVKPTLDAEFEAAVCSIQHARDAVDDLCGALLDEAHETWPDAWLDLAPKPVVIASWVGLDTDGRTDIGWWDSLQIRLRMKRLGLARLLGQVAGSGTLEGRVREALEAVDRQLALVPSTPDPEAVELFAQALAGGRGKALVSPEPLLPQFSSAIADASDECRRRLCIARAGVLAHGLSLAHAHVRLNAAQVHNAIRVQLGLEDPPVERSKRRTLLAAIDEALSEVRPQPIDFGSLLAEQASAVRLMMLVAQITKHVDRHTKVRFLVAETRTGYTLLATLWLARLCGCDRHVEISPLFETPDALAEGVRILEEALRSPHYRAYLRRVGRLCLQFGYSDSGRFLGALPATYLIERLKLRLADLLSRHELGDIEVVLFDTHGESIGRGAHPANLADRLLYLSPPLARAALAEARLQVREESSFQGGDGYLLFATPELALATVARVAEHALRPTPMGTDPIYGEPDFAAGIFATAQEGVQGLVEDPGYASLLGAFGPALLDPTGSRPTARQTDTGGPARIRHPRELRAIPNNAILQQLGWCANTLHGVGAAAARDPELLGQLRISSPRLRRALDLVEHAARHSDLDVLRANVSLLDPASWYDQAAHARIPGRAERLARVGAALSELDLWRPMQPTVRSAQADQLRLRGVWPDLPRMSHRETLLHALRIAIIGRIWLLATSVPDFSPRHGVTPENLRARLLRLEVPEALELLGTIFPPVANAGPVRDYGEPPGFLSSRSYEAEHRRIFEPMGRLFGLAREITVALTHEVGAFG
ncbi:MAG: phosphoenolpyruvate carboxylase [Acetobacteraceae bacterium]|nr:phosphoenolpyruvate carboxylase [Acetobacteraceae bacterium]